MYHIEEMPHMGAYHIQLGRIGTDVCYITYGHCTLFLSTNTFCIKYKLTKCHQNPVSCSVFPSFDQQTHFYKKQFFFIKGLCIKANLRE